MDLLDAPPQQHAPPAHQVRLDGLRQAAQRIDPVRLHYLDVLSQRIATAPDAVQRVLENKLDIALTALESRLRQRQPAAREAGMQKSAAPLAALNRYIEGLRQAGDGPLQGLGLDKPSGHGFANDADARKELPSVRRFREAWSRIAAEDRVTEAVERGPTNAGPLNSHMLVLRTLSPAARPVAGLPAPLPVPDGNPAMAGAGQPDDCPGQAQTGTAQPGEKALSHRPWTSIFIAAHVHFTLGSGYFFLIFAPEPP
jgi:hypothetical protein